MYFSVAWTYRKTRKIEFCNSACTFASKVFAGHYLALAQQRTNLRLQKLKKGD